MAESLVLGFGAWLLDCELSYLSTVSDQFYAKGVSSVSTNENVLRGRPHGGIAIMWRKELTNKCKLMDLNDERLMGIELNMMERIFLF